MTLGGWILLIVSWSAILTLLVFCFTLTLRRKNLD